ncbi:fasciclin domain-containing protein [soil metagenome]
MLLTTVRRGTAAAAVLALSLTLAACGSDDEEATTTGSGSDTETSAAADPSAQTFGPACDQVPADGDGSFVGMSDSPVATAAGANPLLQTLVAAVTSVDGLADTLNDQPALTVFAPYEGAFAEIPEADLNGLLDGAKADGNDSALYKILAHHVLPENDDSDAIVGDHDTLVGDTLTVEGDTDGMTVTDGTVTATVLCGNIPTANATVYVIDKVLTGTDVG